MRGEAAASARTVFRKSCRYRRAWRQVLCASSPLECSRQLRFPRRNSLANGRPRRQRFGGPEIAPVNAIELVLSTLIVEPDHDPQQAVHVRTGGFHQRLEIVYDYF